MNSLNETPSPNQSVNSPIHSSVRIVEGDPLEAARAIREADRREQEFHAHGLRKALADYACNTLTVLHGDDEAVRGLGRRSEAGRLMTGRNS